MHKFDVTIELYLENYQPLYKKRYSKTYDPFITMYILVYDNHFRKMKVNSYLLFEIKIG